MPDSWCVSRDACGQRRSHATTERTGTAVPVLWIVVPEMTEGDRSEVERRGAALVGGHVLGVGLVDRLVALVEQGAHLLDGPGPLGLRPGVGLLCATGPVALERGELGLEPVHPVVDGLHGLE